MAAKLTPAPRFKAWDSDGNFLAGGKLYSFAAGSTTPKATYTDNTGTTPNTNPIILNGAGEADVWTGDGDYKFVLTDADDVEQWTLDNIDNGPLGMFSISSEAGSEGFVKIDTGLQLESSLQIAHGVVFMTSDAAYLAMRNTGKTAYLQAGDPSSGGPTWFADNTFTFPDLAKGGSTDESGFLLAISGAVAAAAPGNALVLDSNFGVMNDSEIGMNQHIVFPLPTRRVTWKNGSFFGQLTSEAITADRDWVMPDADGTVAVWVAVPATATSTGLPGQMARDASFLYICHAANSWKRCAIAAW